MDVEFLCTAKWIGPAHTAPTEVEVLCRARWIVVGPSVASGVRS
jgi:hypothetical protein